MLFSCLQKLFDFFFTWHDTKCTAFGGDEGSSGICEGQHVAQFVFAVSFPPVVEDIVENSTEEGIAGTSGFDGIVQDKAWIQPESASIFFLKKIYLKK